MKENMAPATAPPARTSDIAVIGLAVMGQNLILNMNDNGFVVTAYNRTTAKVDEFLANEAKGTKIVGAHSIEEMCATLKAPRRIMLLVKAGAPVDQFIEAVLPHTEPGDILIDGGNSLFSDTIRRTAHVEAQGRLFIGTGVSGGEEGARTGPSIMPGGRCRCSRRLSTATFTTSFSPGGLPAVPCEVSRFATVVATFVLGPSSDIDVIVPCRILGGLGDASASVPWLSELRPL